MSFRWSNNNFFFRARMRIPTFEHVYQTMEKQHEILLREKAKIDAIKAKVGVRSIDTPLKLRYQFNKPDAL